MVQNDYLTEVLVDLIRGLMREFGKEKPRDWVSLSANICRVDRVYITDENGITFDFEPEFFGEDEEGKYMAHTCTDEMIMVCIYQTLREMLSNN